MPRLFVRLSQRLLDAERRRRDRAALVRLDDRLLRDIGVTAAERDSEMRRLR